MNTAESPQVHQLDEGRYTLTLTVSPDRMRLLCSAAVPKEALAPPLSWQEVSTLIEKSLNVKELDQAVLRDVVQLLNQGKEVPERRIKKGIEPKAARDGRLVLLVKPFTEKRQLNEKESANPSLQAILNQHWFDNLKIGQVVARIYPPQKGTAGSDIFGTPLILPEGRPINVQIKGGLSRRATSFGYEEIVADDEGMVIHEANTLQLRTELLIEGNLDLRIGHLDFVGAVRVKGDISGDLSVRGERGIEVLGDVRGASLYAPRGKIQVRGNVFGGGKAIIRCGDIVELGSAQELDVEASGAILLQRGAVDCSLRSRSVVASVKGALVGGETMTPHGVTALFIGNEAGQPTPIKVVNEIETRAEVISLRVFIEDCHTALNLIELHLGPFKKFSPRLPLANPEVRERLERLRAKHLEITERLVASEEELKKITRQELRHVGPLISFTGAVWPGVSVNLGGNKWSTIDKIDGPASLYFEQDFNMGQFVDLGAGNDGKKRKA